MGNASAKVKVLLKRKVFGIPMPVILLVVLVLVYWYWKRSQDATGTTIGQDPNADANVAGATMDGSSADVGSAFAPTGGFGGGGGGVITYRKGVSAKQAARIKRLQQRNARLQRQVRRQNQGPRSGGRPVGQGHRTTAARSVRGRHAS